MTVWALSTAWRSVKWRIRDVAVCQPEEEK